MVDVELRLQGRRLGPSEGERYVVTRLRAGRMRESQVQVLAWLGWGAARGVVGWEEREDEARVRAALVGDARGLRSYERRVRRRRGRLGGGVRCGGVVRTLPELVVGLSSWDSRVGLWAVVEAIEWVVRESGGRGGEWLGGARRFARRGTREAARWMAEDRWVPERVDGAAALPLAWAWADVQQSARDIVEGLSPASPSQRRRAGRRAAHAAALLWRASSEPAALLEYVRETLRARLLCEDRPGSCYT